MQRSSYKRYIQEIAGSCPLSAEEESALAQLIRQGDDKALDKLVTNNLKYVIHLAKQYHTAGVDINELIAEGNIALLQAAKKYNPEKVQGRFVSYAHQYIAKAIEQALDDNSNGFSIDAPINGKANVSLLSLIPNSDSPSADSLINHNTLSDTILNGLERLNERERKVIEMYFGINTIKLNMAEIAQNMQLKRERIRQIRDKALRKMKKKTN